MEVSVIIVNWNTKDILRECLLSIYTQTEGIEFEVIVIDNSSSDGSVKMVKQEFPHVVLIENNENRGFAAANNQGIEIAKGRYVLLLNSDTVVIDGAIKKVFDFAERNLDAGVIGCRVLNNDRTLQPTCFMFPSILNRLLFMTYLYKLFPNNRFFSRETMGGWQRDNVREVEVVTGCFMLVRQEVIYAVGGMDERFFMYSEEVDWCWRIKQQGWKCLFYPEAEIIHLGGASAVKYGSDRALIKDKSTIRLMFKLWPRWKALLGVLLMIFFYFFRIIYLLPFVLLGKKKPVFLNHVAGLKGLFAYQKYLEAE